MSWYSFIIILRCDVVLGRGSCFCPRTEHEIGHSKWHTTPVSVTHWTPDPWPIGHRKMRILFLNYSYVADADATSLLPGTGTCRFDPSERYNIYTFLEPRQSCDVSVNLRRQFSALMFEITFVRQFVFGKLENPAHYQYPLSVLDGSNIKR